MSDMGDPPGRACLKSVVVLKHIPDRDSKTNKGNGVVMKISINVK